MEFVVYPAESNRFDIDIYMLVYQHEEFLSQAIESVLRQKTHFRYQLIIVDDCSSDRSAEIGFAYKKEYSDRITFVRALRNTKGQVNRVVEPLFNGANYFTILEGDDYWTNYDKIENDISFLEENPQYIGITHNVRCVDQKGDFLHKHSWIYSYREDHIYNKYTAMQIHQISHLSSLLHRSIFRDWSQKDFDDLYMCGTNDDLLRGIILGLMGEVYYSHKIYGDHRMTFSGTSWTAQTYNKNNSLLMFKQMKNLRRYFKKTMGIEFDVDKLLQKRWKEAKINFIQKMTFENLKNVMGICREFLLP